MAVNWGALASMVVTAVLGAVANKAIDSVGSKTENTIQNKQAARQEKKVIINNKK